VPANGMGEIPRQLAANLAEKTLHLNTVVREVTANSVTLADGTSIAADAVVVATDPTTAATLANSDDPGWRGVTTLWMSAPEPPVIEPVLTLNGEGVRPINSLAVMSQVSGRYSPADRALIAVNSPFIEPALVDAMQAQLRTWFGPVTDRWDLLRVDQVARSLPRQLPGFDAHAAPQLESGVWICGDHRTNSSIDGALRSGREVARAAMASASTR